MNNQDQQNIRQSLADEEYGTNEIEFLIKDGKWVPNQDSENTLQDFEPESHSRNGSFAGLPTNQMPRS